MQNVNQEGSVNINGNVSVGNDLVGHDKIEVHLHGIDDKDQNKTYAVCPKCGTNEQTQKVSAICSSGMPLAQKFTPPLKPPAPAYPLKFYIGILMAIGCGIWGLVLVFFLLNLLFEGYRDWTDLLGGMACVVFLSIWGSLIARNAHNEKKRQETEYPLKISEWESQSNLWNNLYYCHKDGTVFNYQTQQQYDN